MSRTQGNRRFVPLADALPTRIVPTVNVCPMAPVLIDYRLPETDPTAVNPMDPTNVDVYAFVVTDARA